MLRLLLAITALGFASRLTAAETIKLNGHTFTLPDGFEIELIAGPPQVKRPIAAAFDERGRLHVTEASGTNDPVAKQLAAMPHTLLRLVDANGDGKFETVTTFADKLMLPQGVMVLGGSVYVGHPPVITKFTEDGKRETWFDGKTLTGCANDLHGPYAGPDGWIYWTKGAFAEQKYTLPNGKPFVTKASHIFRARPDGTGLEPVMTGGMDNPVDVAFTPTGDRIFTTTFLQHPAGGKRDGLIHAIHGGVYGKDHAPVHQHPWTGPDLMPVLTHLGAAAPCGLHRLESDRFGLEYRDNLFACSFNMHKVTRHVLVPEGATYRTIDSDFLVSDNLDFHPTDAIEDADGSLLIVDTGGWYKLCCPTSQLVKPDVFGAIYRVKRKGSHNLADPRGLKLEWKDAKDVATRLDDIRPAVRQRAIEWLGATPQAAIPVLEKLMRESKSPLARRNALWAASRFDLHPVRTFHPGPGQPQVLISCTNIARNALDDEDASVRLVALHLVSLYRFKDAAADLTKLIATGSPPEKRAAAEALGRIGDRAAVPALLAALKEPADRVLRHSLTFALIEIGHPETTAAGLKDTDPKVRAAVLIALDQMSGGGLTAGQVLANIDPPFAGDWSASQAAWWVLGRRPELASGLAPRFREQLSKPVPRQALETLVDQLARVAGNPDVQKVIADAARGEFRMNPSASYAGLRAMSQSGLKTIPPVWADALAHSVEHVNAPIAVQTIRLFPAGTKLPQPVIEALRKVGNPQNRDTGTALAALAAVPGGLPEVAEPLFLFLLGRFDADSDRPEFVPETVEILSKAKLTPAQLAALVPALKKVGPIELPKLLNAFTRSTDESLGLLLVSALHEPKIRWAIRTETIQPILDRYPAKVKAEAAKLYLLLDADRADQRAKLETLLAETKGGDVRRGQVVFNNTKAACITCHSMGYLGGKVGPDLTRIGGIRTERDLLEAIVFPSASFVRSYEPTKVVTLDGRVFNGIVKSDTPQEVVLVVSATEEVRIARADIESQTPGLVSVMPSGLDQQLTKQDLADLIAFLKASK